MAAPMKPIIIIGAGVSGLCLAQGLKKNTELPFRVLERDPSLHARSQGYRVRLSGEGLVSLKHSLSPEVYERLHANGCAFVHEGTSHSSIECIIDGYTGKPGKLNLGWKADGDDRDRHHEHLGNEESVPFAVDRGVLREVLWEGLSDIVEFNKHFMSYETLPDGTILAKFSDGTTVEGSALVGADGCWSRTRHRLIPDYSLKDSGARVIWGKANLTPDFVEALPEQARSGIGFFSTPELKVLFEAMRFDRSQPGVDKALVPDDYFYYLCYPRSETLGMSDAQFLKLTNDQAAELAKRLTKDWETHAQTPFQRVAHNAASVSRIPTATPDIPVWADEIPVTLMGDAVHSMAPTAALGATTALRDSYHLCRQFETLPANPQASEIAQVLRQYEKEMRVYAAQALELSAIGGKTVFDFKGFDKVPEIELHD